MTSEIAALNRGAVAIAADSAMTIGGKVFNSANKIFSLSRYHPIGIMVYGNADFLGIPWETIIKLYRDKYNETDLPSVKDHCKRFFQFIEQEANIFDTDYIEFDIKDRLSSHAKEIFDPIYKDSTVPQKSKIRLKRMVGKKIDDDYKAFQKHRFVRGFTENRHSELKGRLEPVLDDVINDAFGDSVSSSLRQRRLKNVLVSYLTKEWANYGDSGVVITGFGLDEHFPALYCYECRGMIDGVVWRVLRNETVISEAMRATLVPFAQTDVTATFIAGIDPEFSVIIETFMKKAFTGLKRTVRSKNFSDKADDLLNTFLQSFDQYRNDKHVNPMIGMLAVLPKDELAKLAESLVEITSLKRHVTEERETVGGPIDVAVISKGDGLVWLSRKHYFDAMENPDYFLRHKKGLRGVANEKR